MEKQDIPMRSPASESPPRYSYGQASIPPAERYPYADGQKSATDKMPLTSAQNFWEPEIQYAPPPPPACAHEAYTSQPHGYLQQPATVIYARPVPLVDPPDDYLGYSIFVTICCCWMIGIAAIVSAADCRAAVAAGDRERAVVKSRKAKRLSNIALGFGIGSIIGCIIYVICARHSTRI